jgi:hypothetical protein
MGHYGATSLTVSMVELVSDFGPGGGVKLLQVFYIGIVWYGFLGVFLSGQGLSLPVCAGATCTGDCSTSVKPHSIITPHSIIELLFYVITCPI